MKKIAKCYGIWGGPYYRTDDGHTFSIEDNGRGSKTVFYYGNVISGPGTLKLLNEEEKARLFENVEFVN